MYTLIIRKVKRRKTIANIKTPSMELSSSIKMDLGTTTDNSDASQSNSGNTECLKTTSAEDVIPNEPSRKQLRRRITVMMGLMTAASIASLLPYFLIQLIAEYKRYEYPMWLSLLNHTYVLNSTVNPFILGFCNTDFRSYVISLLCFRCKKRLQIIKETTISIVQHNIYYFFMSVCVSLFLSVTRSSTLLDLNLHIGQAHDDCIARAEMLLVTSKHLPPLHTT
ncbi:hypothetical protein DPMN_158044 [Dreissena polymorpha]|uniref:G-protein coupled receptors family 1 profile domain-containing protein n=1 Tax=Dreissena polymorpha TaxID=45954 RepID=A0A9D4EGM0_DREPO|nr:hypothetical protein DPMN_158044 [Dreissena polymorpha]